jgi:hypothetical protein
LQASIVERILRLAAERSDFRRRALRDLGLALAEEGFILTDAEMATMRDYFEPLRSLSDRASQERIAALAWQSRRER